MNNHTADELRTAIEVLDTHAKKHGPDWVKAMSIAKELRAELAALEQPKRWPDRLDAGCNIRVFPHGTSIAIVGCSDYGGDLEPTQVYTYLTPDNAAEFALHVLSLTETKWTLRVNSESDPRIAEFCLVLPDGTQRHHSKLVWHDDHDMIGQDAISKAAVLELLTSFWDGALSYDDLCSHIESMTAPKCISFYDNDDKTDHQRFMEGMQRCNDHADKPKCQTCGGSGWEESELWQQGQTIEQAQPCPDCQSEAPNTEWAGFGLLLVKREGANLLFKSQDNPGGPVLRCPHGAVNIELVGGLVRHLCTIAGVNIYADVIERLRGVCNESEFIPAALMAIIRDLEKGVSDV